MNDSSEATHYQIELTSRQVLTALAVLLTCLFAAFFAGVWIGRNAASDQAALALASVGDVQGADQQYDFFSRTTVPSAGESSSGGEPPPAESASREAKFGGSDGDAGPTMEEPIAERAPNDEEYDGAFGEELDPIDSDASLDEPVPVERGEDLPPPEDMGRGGRRRAARADDMPPADDPESPPADAPAVAAAPTAPVASGFTIQVLATSDRQKAQALIDRLVDADFNAFLAPSNEGGRTVYRVRVGPFRDRALATRQANELESRWGLDSWISPGNP